MSTLPTMQFLPNYFSMLVVSVNGSTCFPSASPLNSREGIQKYAEECLLGRSNLCISHGLGNMMESLLPERCGKGVSSQLLPLVTGIKDCSSTDCSEASHPLSQHSMCVK